MSSYDWCLGKVWIRILCYLAAPIHILVIWVVLTFEYPSSRLNAAHSMYFCCLENWNIIFSQSPILYISSNICYLEKHFHFPSQKLLCGGKILLAVCLMLICVLPGAGWQDATTSLRRVLAKFARSGLVTSFILSFLLLWYSYFSLAHIPRHMEMSRVSRTGTEHARRYCCSMIWRADTKCPVCTKLRAKYNLHRPTVIGSPRYNAMRNCWTEMRPATSACNQQDSKNQTC